MAAINFHRDYRLYNRPPLAGSGQKNAFRIVDRLAKIGNRAVPFLRGTNEFVALRSDDKIARCPDQTQCYRIGIDDTVCSGINDEDSRLYGIENGLKADLVLL